MASSCSSASHQDQGTRVTTRSRPGRVIRQTEPETSVAFLAGRAIPNRKRGLGDTTAPKLAECIRFAPVAACLANACS